MENREIPIKDNKYRNNFIKNIFYAIGAAVITVLLVYLLMRTRTITRTMSIPFSISMR